MSRTFAVTSPSERLAPAHPPILQRTVGEARISFQRTDGVTRLHRLYQNSASKVRLPRPEPGQPPLAVLINTAGGLTGGDAITGAVAVGAGCRALVTSQSCERIYRSIGGEVEIATTLQVDDGARLDWLPQETILFDGGRLRRRLSVELAGSASLLVVEAAIFGRAASGERVGTGRFADRWRIRRDGTLIFADDLAFDWTDSRLLARPAVLGGASAMASLLLVSDRAERHLDRLRATIGDRGGASAWNGKLLARISAEGGSSLRRVLIPAITDLLDGAALPKPWLC